MQKTSNKLRNLVAKTTFYEQNIVITGKRKVLVENVRHIYEINEIMARIKTTDGDIVIWGEDLKAKSYNGSAVTIVGKISSCEIQERTVGDEI